MDIMRSRAKVLLGGTTQKGNGGLRIEHHNHNDNLLVAIATFRGCNRSTTGTCDDATMMVDEMVSQIFCSTQRLFFGEHGEHGI
jgi:radical SAM superfamily enzyme with C-terminal helix-hairpin-helix motif